jgi:membrane protein implicated in regulation of membrane protease activity
VSAVATDVLVWVVFAALFIGAALLVKVAAALLVVLVVLALLLGLVLRTLRKRRVGPPRR